MPCVEVLRFDIGGSGPAGGERASPAKPSFPTRQSRSSERFAGGSLEADLRLGTGAVGEAGDREGRHVHRRLGTGRQGRQHVPSTWTKREAVAGEAGPDMEAGDGRYAGYYWYRVRGDIQ